MHEGGLLFFHGFTIGTLEIQSFVVYSWVAMAFLLTIAIIVRTSLKLVPTGVQNIVEIIVEMMLDFCRKNIGHWGEHFFPFIATIGLYILVCNTMGLIPGFEAPTGNLNTNAAMAVPVFLATHVYGVKVNGFGYIKHFLGPVRSLIALPLMILMFIVEVLGHISRPITLSVRLFGNMMAKHMLLLILGMLAPWFIPIPILVLGVLVSVVQAAVFVILTTLYLAGAVEKAH
jgi:F-type H+-transporting ATPase subunit a